MAPRLPIAQRYRLDECIGEGGMGEVWRAFDTVLKREVAVKLFRAGGFESEDRARARFQREAQAIAALRHPGIAVLYDYGEDYGPEGYRPYLVMELIEGRPLSRVIADGPLPTDRAMRICAEVADALAFAHRAGIVHRDVKPANIIVDPEDHPRLLDFGIAHVKDDATLTGADVHLGTLSYASPEQIDGLGAGPSSDIYSLGVVAYECLTGRPPFTGSSISPIINGHLHKPPPPLPKSTPKLAVRAVMGALEKDPPQRWASADELAAACRGQAPKPSLARRLLHLKGGTKGRVIALAAGAAVVLLAAVGATIPYWDDSSENDQGTQAEPASYDLDEALEAGAFTQVEPAIQAHGDEIGAMVTLKGPLGEPLLGTTTGQGAEVRFWDLETGELHAEADYPEPIKDFLPASFPDGTSRLIAIGAEGGVHVADVADLGAVPEHVATVDTDAWPKAEQFSTYGEAGRQILIGLTPKGARRVDLGDGTSSRGMRFEGAGEADRSALVGFRGRAAVAIVGENGRTVMYDAVTGEPSSEEFGPGEAWNEGTDTADGLWVAYQGVTPYALVHNATTGEYQRWNLANLNALSAPAPLGPFDTDYDTELVPLGGKGHLLAVADEEAYVLRTADGERTPLTAEDAPEAIPVTTAYTEVKAHALAVIGYNDGTIRIWNLGT
ncbi:serine/threonine-protein kinase [Glycomyces buryatensis]|uniref:non-specific serine/threonine protein kinase n=1 Tax=Glycomyces buryatensis TaxID=2570927 RepID=A0A4S8QHR1_9ACTN|nr:serine/threonine-protein kinase [Glycomyces buryatensis]THV42782.1 serine/threonine protein kinase [Glycomyces buryatensis]